MENKALFISDFEIDWNFKQKDISKLNHVTKSWDNWIEILDFWDGVEFRAWLKFGTITKRLKEVKLELPKDHFKNSRHGSQIAEFLQTYDLIKKKIGEPGFVSGVAVEKLKNLNIDHLYKEYKKALPNCEWRS